MHIHWSFKLGDRSRVDGECYMTEMDNVTRGRGKIDWKKLFPLVEGIMTRGMDSSTVIVPHNTMEVILNVKMGFHLLKDCAVITLINTVMDSSQQIGTISLYSHPIHVFVKMPF
eukprot:g40827.t1